MDKSTFVTVYEYGDFDDRETEILYAGQDKEAAKEAILKAGKDRGGHVTITKWDGGERQASEVYALQTAWTLT